MYGGVHGVYYHLLYATEKWLLGSKIHEWNWMRRSGEAAAELLETVGHPHRAFLVKEVAKWTPLRRVLEVGCNVGSNLALLARRFPEATFYGIDINEHFVEVGRDWLAREGLNNVRLAVGKADDLTRFADGSMDVTFTDATLLYVGPDRIDRTLQEMKRVTFRALVFNEWHCEGTQSRERSLWYYLHWVHNYRFLLEALVPSRAISISKLPRDLWAAGGGWEQFGALIEVEL